MTIRRTYQAALLSLALTEVVTLLIPQVTPTALPHELTAHLPTTLSLTPVSTVGCLLGITGGLVRVLVPPVLHLGERRTRRAQTNNRRVLLNRPTSQLC